MTIIDYKKNSLLKILGMFFALSSINSHAASESTWQFDVAPYLWAIQMNGSIQVGPEKMTVSESFIDIMKHFKGGGMLWLSAHKNKVGFFVNTLYSVLKVNDELRERVLSARNNFGIVSAGMSYVIFQNETTNRVRPIVVEVLAGARYTLNDTTLNLARFSISDNQRWTDPVIGARVTYRLNNQWQALLEGDGGGMNSHYSYNLQGYIGYTPKKRILFDHTIFYLGYRLLHQQMHSGQGIRFYQWDMNISGPVIGMNAHF